MNNVRVVGGEHGLRREDAFSDASNERPYDVSARHVDELESSACGHVQTKPAVRRTLTSPQCDTLTSDALTSPV